MYFLLPGHCSFLVANSISNKLHCLSVSQWNTWENIFHFCNLFATTVFTTRDLLILLQQEFSIGGEEIQYSVLYFQNFSHFKTRTNPLCVFRATPSSTASSTPAPSPRVVSTPTAPPPEPEPCASVVPTMKEILSSSVTSTPASSPPAESMPSVAPLVREPSVSVAPTTSVTPSPPVVWSPAPPTPAASTPTAQPREGE